jgi:methylaspartate ammonia-lyase
MVVVFCVSVGLVGCGGKEPLYPAEHERFLRIDQAVESLRGAYVSKDLLRIQSLLLPLDPLEQMEAEIQRDFDTFQQLTLNFAVERITIDGESIDVFVHWQGTWKKSESDTGLRERGHARLRWVGVQSILLQQVEGDLPFGMASRRNPPS